MNECYKCIHRRSLTYSAHSECVNNEAKVEGLQQGIKRGWFNWPINFDPTWLVSCDGFQAKDENKND